MPILIFIAQRLILLALAIMTFLGVASEETYLSASNKYKVEQERKPAITEILESSDPIIIVADQEGDKFFEKIKINNVLDKINEDFPIFGQKESVAGTDPTEDVAEEKFDTEIQTDTQELLNDLEAELNRLKDEAARISAESSSEDQTVPKKEALHITNVASNAVINIMCLERNGTGLNIVTGSGVIINPNGTILTNGHVAQHLLNQDDPNIDCEIKNPNHSKMRYRAVISYIPSIWKSSGMFNLKYGTGEDDYAFLSIVGPAPDGELPDSFPYIEISTDDDSLEVGNDIFMLGYPGKHTGVYSSDTNLQLVTDTSYITDVFTLNKFSKDIFSTGVSPVAMQGSSGGAVLDEGKLIGIISTTNEQESGGKILNAISLSYIKRDLAEAGISINTFLK